MVYNLDLGDASTHETTYKVIIYKYETICLLEGFY